VLTINIVFDGSNLDGDLSGSCLQRMETTKRDEAGELVDFAPFCCLLCITVCFASNYIASCSEH